MLTAARPFALTLKSLWAKARAQVRADLKVIWDHYDGERPTAVLNKTGGV